MQGDKTVEGNDLEIAVLRLFHLYRWMNHGDGRLLFEGPVVAVVCDMETQLPNDAGLCVCLDMLHQPFCRLHRQVLRVVFVGF